MAFGRVVNKLAATVNLDPIRDDPRFVAMMNEVRADVDRMRRAL